ncbi:class I SAM-dependent methyltransferase [Alcanivorax limicola]|uniref:class I SAM-dependent methyltransferase n=1 Tax=Alcanivorax limicola TaxID=2874102 RepID=UPI001CBC055E|nr:methyltransferase [Alcanivorax limicola]
MHSLRHPPSRHAPLLLTATLLLSATLLLGACQNGAQHDPIIAATQGEHRTAAFVARDVWRRPVETLAFFNVEPDMTVVEIWPGAGWYTEILAPLLRDEGQLYAAHFDPDTPVPFFQRSLVAYQDKLAAEPAVYDRVALTVLAPPAHTAIAPPASADRVLTFRNVHNWASAGSAEAAFSAFHTALRPGGILGVVEHRAPAGRDLDEQIASGYMTEEYVIALAEAAGFELLERSEINANPADSADHPEGVWTLPPSLRLGDTDREHYLAIGESDRMTLKFRKP